MTKTRAEKRKLIYDEVAARFSMQGYKMTRRLEMLFQTLELIGANPAMVASKTIEYDDFDGNHYKTGFQRIKIKRKITPAQVTAFTYDLLKKYDEKGVLREIGDITHLKIELCSAKILQYVLGENWREQINEHIKEQFEAAKSRKTHSVKPSYRQIKEKLKVRFGEGIVNITIPLSENVIFRNTQITLREVDLPDALLSGLEGKKINDLLSSPFMNNAFDGYVVEDTEKPGSTVIRLKSQKINITDNIT